MFYWNLFEEIRTSNQSKKRWKKVQFFKIKGQKKCMQGKHVLEIVVLD